MDLIYAAVSCLGAMVYRIGRTGSRSMYTVTVKEGITRYRKRVKREAIANTVTDTWW